MKIPIPVVLVLVGLLQIAGAAAPAVTNTVQSASQKKAPAKKKPPTVKKAPAGKHVAGKAPTRKPPVAKAPTKRAPVKKAPARRVTQYKAAPPVDPTDGDNVDGDDLTVSPSLMARIDAFHAVFANARLIADGIAESELPPISCKPLAPEK